MQRSVGIKIEDTGSCRLVFRSWVQHPFLLVSLVEALDPSMENSNRRKYWHNVNIKHVKCLEQCLAH